MTKTDMCPSQSCSYNIIIYNLYLVRIYIEQMTIRDTCRSLSLRKDKII